MKHLSQVIAPCYGLRRRLSVTTAVDYKCEAGALACLDFLVVRPVRTAPTNEAYAVARIAGLKMTAACGHSLVQPAFLQAVSGSEDERGANRDDPGTGTPLREFLHPDDLASAAGLR
jgi:hypothetical protein